MAVVTMCPRFPFDSSLKAGAEDGHGGAFGPPLVKTIRRSGANQSGDRSRASFTASRTRRPAA